MWISKVQYVAATTVVIATLGAGTGVVTHRVLAKDVSNANAPAEGKKGSSTADGIHWNATVDSINADSIIVNLAVKGSGPVTLKLADDVKVELAGFKDKTPKPAKLADVTPGASVVLELSSDKTTVNRIELGGSHIRGRIKEIDAAKHAITVTVSSKAGGFDKTLPVHEDARIAFAGGKVDKNEKGKGPANEAKFSDLAVGQPVAVAITSDGANITEVTVEATSAGGRVSHVDPAAKSITISAKGEGGLSNQTFTLGPDTPILVGTKGDSHPGSLSDVSEGMGVAVQFSARDAKLVTSLRVWKTEPAEETGGK
jgi:hypothetical protein